MGDGFVESDIRSDRTVAVGGGPTTLPCRGACRSFVDVMDDSGRIDALEARLGRVESELRKLIDAIDVARAEARDATDRSVAPASETDAAAEPTSGAPASPLPATTPRRAPGRAPRRPRRSAEAGRDFEAWFGENALLVVGVLALVAAVGFALKHAIEQGWISAALRVLAGLAAGLGLAAYGEVTVRRGLHRFGAAAIGAGAALAYLAMWAAAGPYAFVSVGVGLAALAILSGLVLLSAWRSDEPYLGAMAAAGAYLAPFVLGDVSTSADLLLSYSALVSLAIAPIAALNGWRSTVTIVVVGFFWSAVAALGDADSAWLAIYVAAGGGAVVALARGAKWRAHEIGAWLAAWVTLLVAAATVEGASGWSLALAPALLVAPGWFAARRAGPGAAGPSAAGREPAYRRWMLVSAALLWTGVALSALPPAVEDYPLLVAAPIAVLYLVPALRRRIPLLLIAGIGGLGLGVPDQWDATDATLGWCALIAATALLTRRTPLSSARWVGVVLGFAAMWRLLSFDLFARPDADPAFVGAWPLALYTLIAALALLAIDGWDEDDRYRAGGLTIDLRVVTWLLAGILLLWGGTIEIARLDISGLAAGLVVSAFWLLYAGGLLAFGFRTNRKAVRVTGLVVAALAIWKVAFYDLANLDALYRVGSFALLAVLALVGARAYHGRARREAATE
jgi:uncharacterized membrane protein